MPAAIGEWDKTLNHGILGVALLILLRRPVILIVFTLSTLAGAAMQLSQEKNAGFAYIQFALIILIASKF